MQITCLGHAGLHIQTRGGTILCDPWKNPAYFGSWCVFPDNSGLDWDRYGRVDYLYVSHLHQDHFDPRLLSKHVSRAATVLLPDFPVPDLRDRLARDDIRPVSSDLGGLRVAMSRTGSQMKFSDQLENLDYRASGTTGRSS